MEKKIAVMSNTSDLADFFLCNRSQAVPVKSESDDTIRPDPINLIPEKRKYYKQPKDISGKFYKTLPGFLIQVLENLGPTPEEELVELLGKHLSGLRAACGSIYKNKPGRCLNGVCKMPIFSVEGGIWSLKKDEVVVYREKFMQKCKKTGKRIEVKKNGIRKSERIINVLRGYSLQLAKDSRTEALIKNPIKELTGDEDLFQAAKKIGHERLIGVLQSYSVVSKYFMQKLKREDDSTDFLNIERDIDGIYMKLSRIEDHLVRYSVTESKSESLKRE